MAVYAFPNRFLTAGVCAAAPTRSPVPTQLDQGGAESNPFVMVCIGRHMHKPYSAAMVCRSHQALCSACAINSTFPQPSTAGRTVPPPPVPGRQDAAPAAAPPATPPYPVDTTPLVPPPPANMAPATEGAVPGMALEEAEDTFGRGATPPPVPDGQAPESEVCEHAGKCLIVSILLHGNASESCHAEGHIRDPGQVSGPTSLQVR
jgi:hypothetical protein